MKMAFILLDGKARTNVLLSTFKDPIVDMDSIVIILSQDKDLLTIEKKISEELRLLIIYSKGIEDEQYAKGRAFVHELNNNLAIVASSLFITKKLLKKEEVDLVKIEKMITDVGTTSDNIQKIIKGFSAELEGNVVTYELMFPDLIYYFENTIVPFLLTSRVEYNLNYDIPAQGNFKIKTTGIHVSQIIINLVKNGAEATKTQNERKVDLQAIIKNDRLRIIVTDNGPGVPVEHQEDIFKENFSTKGDQGNGIGLYICKKNIKRSGGLLEYDKEYKDGGRFIVDLPLERLDD